MLPEFDKKVKRSTEEFLRSVLDSSIYGIIVLDAVRNESKQIIDFSWLFINDSAEEIIERTFENIEGKLLSETMPEFLEEGAFDKYKNVVETDQEVKFEQHYLKNDIEKWFKVSAVKFQDGVTLTFKDITGYKNAILDVEYREKKYKTLFEESIDSIFVVDEQFRFLDKNPAFYSLFGGSDEELRANNLSDFFTQNERFILFKESMKHHSFVEGFEVDLKGKKKKTCIINCKEIIDHTTGVKTYLGLIVDVTKLKKAEKELLVAEKLSMTGKIARTIAHEVRNPLTNLSLAVEQLKDEVIDQVDDADLYITIIQRNTERISTLITNLLNSSKPKELDLRTQSLNQVIQQSLSLVTDRLNLQGIKLVENYATDIPNINLDSDQLQVAFVNLFINAIEAMTPEQGILSVKTLIEDEQVNLKIEDNGNGISSENVNKLFDPFYTAKQEGTGLGLTTVQNIIQSHHGNIDVESTLGLGTCFTIQFQL